jgi:hypothetical protein
MSTGLKANSDGSAAIQVGGSDAIQITSGLAATFVNNATVSGNLTVTGTLTASSGVSGAITRGTAVASTSGTSIDFTSIPSTVKRITVMFNGVSTNSTSVVLIQLGSTSFSTSGYTATGLGSSTTALATSNYTTGFGIADSNAAASVYSGQIIISNISSNVWIASYVMTRGTQQTATGAGVSPSLAGVLDRVRITTVNGTDTFDAGSINIFYE